MLRRAHLNVMHKRRIVTVAVLGSVLAACAVPDRAGRHAADVAGMSRADPNSAWRAPTHLELTLKHGADVSAWRCSYSPDGTVLLESLATDAVGNALLLVGGHALALRGAMPLRRDALDLVDAAMLDQQLATRLLQQASPQGPELVMGPQRVQVDGSDDPVSTETTNTSRYFYPPWSLRGELRRVTANSIGFDLQFNAQPTNATARSEHYSLSGLWQQHTPAPQITDDFSLAGWSVYRIRMGTRDAGGISIASYVTSTDSRRYLTLGELRAALPAGR